MSWSLKSILFNHDSNGKKTHVVLKHSESGEERSINLDDESGEHDSLSAKALQRMAVEQIDLA